MTSRVTLVDGIEGSISYRDIPIPDLVGKACFEDVIVSPYLGLSPSAAGEREVSESSRCSDDPPSNGIRCHPVVPVSNLGPIRTVTTAKRDI